MRKQFHATVDGGKKTLTGGNLEENTDDLLDEGEEGEIWQVKDGKKRGSMLYIKKTGDGGEESGGTKEEKLEQA